MRLLGICLVAVVSVFSLSSCGDTSDGKDSGVPDAARGEPIKIGICLPSEGPWAELGRLQALGIRTACGMYSEKTGRGVELVFRDAGGSPDAYADSLQKLLNDDRVAGILSCPSAEGAARASEVLAREAMPFIVTSPCSMGLKKDDDLPGIRICTTQENQAYACARFLSDKLGARRIGIVVDVEDPFLVKTASLFSSELTMTSGRLVDIAYVQKGQDVEASLTHLMGVKPDAVYIALPAQRTLAVIEKVRSIDAAAEILIGPFPAEEPLLAGTGDVLDGVYIQTDFIGESVNTPRGVEFMEYFRKHEGHRTVLGSSVATGAEGFFLMLDVISTVQRSDIRAALQKAASWKGSLMGFTGVTPSGAVYGRITFGKIEKKFLGKTTVSFAASVPVKDSDPVADVGAQ